jgi:hypothetical protein
MPTGRLLPTMAASDRPTTITIRPSTRRLLESMKRPGETYDELIQELAKEYSPPSVIAELKGRLADIRAGRVKPVSTEEVARSWRV